MIELFGQSGMNMMKLYVSSRPKLSNSYNMEYRDTNVSIPISIQPRRQLSHLANVGISRTLENMVMRIFDENMIKITYCDQRKYDSSKPSDNQDEDAMGLNDGGGGCGGVDDEVSYSRI